MVISQIQTFLDKLKSWASVQKSINAVALIGSYAREQASSDSDIDIMLLCISPDEYIKNRTWLETFGKVKSCEIEYYGLCTSLRTIFSDGKEVEFGIVPPEWLKIPVDSGTRKVVSDGINILVDKSGALTKVVEIVNKSKHIV